MLKMMSQQDLINFYIQGVIARSEQIPSSPEALLSFIGCRSLIASNLASREWQLRGYDSQLFSLLLRLGDDFFSKENFGLAAQFYFEALFMFPETPVCYVKVAQCQGRTGHIREAKKTCLKAMNCSKKYDGDLPVDYLLVVVDIMMQADALEEALDICYGIQQTFPANIAIPGKIKGIEKRLEEKAKQKEEREKKIKKLKEPKQSLGNKRKTAEKGYSQYKVEKSAKQIKKEQLAREKSIKEQVEIAKKKQEEELEKKRKRQEEIEKEKRRLKEIEDKKKKKDAEKAEKEKKRIQETTLHAKQNFPAASAVKTAVKPRQTKSKNSDIRERPSLDNMSTNMDEKLSSGSILRRICPKCFSPRAVKSQATTCHSCHTELKLYYRKVNEKKWVEPRKPPDNVHGGYVQCKHFQARKRCVKTPCTFAHGTDEIEIWTLCRGGKRKTRSKKPPSGATMQKSSSCMALYGPDVSNGCRSRTQSQSSSWSLQRSFRPFDTRSSSSRDPSYLEGSDTQSCGSQVEWDPGLVDDGEWSRESWSSRLGNDKERESMDLWGSDCLGHNGEDRDHRTSWGSSRSSDIDNDGDGELWGSARSDDDVSCVSWSSCHSSLTDDYRSSANIPSEKSLERRPGGELDSELATVDGASVSKENQTDDDGWITVTGKAKKTKVLPRSSRSKFQLLCGCCRNRITTTDSLEVVNTRLCRHCNRSEKPIQQYWDGQSGNYRTLRSKPSGIKNVLICWHFVKNHDHFMPDCKFAHGTFEKMLWEKEMEREKSDKQAAAMVQETPPPVPLMSAGDIVSFHLEQEFLRCKYCDLRFSSRHELQHHNSEVQHKVAIVKKLNEARPNPESDNVAKYRSPPHGIHMGRYKLCRRFENGWCYLGNNCTFAHGMGEKSHWEKIFQEQKNDLLQLEKEKLFLESFSQKVRRLRREGRAVLKESLPGVKIVCHPVQAEIELNERHDNQPVEHLWIFDVRVKTTCQNLLRRVAFLFEDHLDKFQLLRTPNVSDQTQTTQNVELSEDSFVEDSSNNESAVQFCVKFISSVFGEFHQELVLEFGDGAYLSQPLKVSLLSKELRENFPISCRSISCKISEWSLANMEQILFPDPKLVDAEGLREMYFVPNQLLDPTKIEEFTPSTYCRLWHEMLFIEEQYILNEVARYDIRGGEMRIIKDYNDVDGTQYFASAGELYGELFLHDYLVLDETAGHLVQRSVLSVVVRAKGELTNRSRVYECLIKVRTAQSIVVQLNQELRKDLHFRNGDVITVDLKFKFNRLPVCEMHQAVDRCRKKTYHLLPEVRPVANQPQRAIPDWFLESKPNNKQHKAIAMILSPSPTLPVLVVGPFGTGKTFTLNMACVEILKSRSSRVLICTHSNSAADIHLDLLHNASSKGHLRPTRILNTFVDARRIPRHLRNYCLLDESGNVREPTWTDLDKCNVMITTLATSRILWKFYDQKELRFTHILIDEAAQALEPECVTPLTMADESTKVVLAGDHMQMGPQVYSSRMWPEDLGPRRSLLERLFAHYKKCAPGGNSICGDRESLEPPHVVMLTENYRCNDEILSFPSKCYYGGELVASGKQPVHPSVPALSFYAAQGVDEQPEGALGYYNLAEVAEVVTRVEELLELWPNDWVENIGVLTPYREQVERIRHGLRRKGLGRINVERVENVQGKEFRALFLSTVRTCYTCRIVEGRNSDSDDLDFGFLSDNHLLNTAVTRAQSLLAVVGDPMSLCTVGACQKIWKDYLDRCHRSKGLHGCTLKIIMDFCLSARALDPHAQEFTPSGVSSQVDSAPHNSNADQPQGAAQIQVNPDQNSPGFAGVEGDRLNASARNGGVVNTPTDNVTSKNSTAGEIACSLDRRDGASRHECLSNNEGEGEEVEASNLKKEQKSGRLESHREGGEREGKGQVRKEAKEEEGREGEEQEKGERGEEGKEIEERTEGTGEREHEKQEERIAEEKQSVDEFFSLKDNDDFDEIIEALIQACKETKKKGQSNREEATTEDFPPLNGAEMTSSVTQAKWPHRYPSAPRVFSAGMRDGRIELGFHIKESERLFRLTRASPTLQSPDDMQRNDTQVYDCEKLLTLLHAKPEEYLKCTFRTDLGGRQRRHYGQVPHPDSPDILISGRVRGIYDDDLVVVEIQNIVPSREDDVPPKTGLIKGVLRMLIDPRERQFVCTVDRNQLGIMLPINKASPRLMNFTKTDEENMIPIYEMSDKGKVTKAVTLREKQVKEALAGERVFVVKFLKWRIDCPYPLGLAVKHLRCGKDFRTGMEILYEEYSVKREFSKTVRAACKKKIGNAQDWRIPALEKGRPAYRDGVFTVDPPESRDLDDAISAGVLGSGNYEVQIHIADVSYFVLQNSPLDDGAKSRGTSYYPPKPDEAVPMLPRDLSEVCCSLLEGKDRLAITVSVELRDDGTVVGKPKFERSVVRSSCRLTYHEAQEVINEGLCNGGSFERYSGGSGTAGDYGVQGKEGGGEGEGDPVNPQNAPEKKTKMKKKKKMGEDEYNEAGLEAEQVQSGKGCSIPRAANVVVSSESNERAQGDKGEEKRKLEDESSVQETELVLEKKKEIPRKVKEAIFLVHKLAVKRRRSRLREGSFYHQKDGDDEGSEDTEAHEMVAEMMIMANHLVGKYLLEKFPECTPLVVQPPPKSHRVEEWTPRFQELVNYSLGIKSLGNTEQNEEQKELDIKVPSQTWKKIVSLLNMASDPTLKFRELVKVVCDVDQYPQLALAYAHQKKVQQRASYVCSAETAGSILQGGAAVVPHGEYGNVSKGDSDSVFQANSQNVSLKDSENVHQKDSGNVSRRDSDCTSRDISEKNVQEVPENVSEKNAEKFSQEGMKGASLENLESVTDGSENVSQICSWNYLRGHYSLELGAYCHFTSPIRRYIDVVVHRLLLASMKNERPVDLDQENMTTVCDRCTFFRRNSQRFDRDARKLQLAVNLQTGVKFLTALIDEIERDRFTLFFGSKEYDALRGRDKSVRIARLGPHKDPVEEGDQVTLHWEFRLLRLDNRGRSQPIHRVDGGEVLTCSNKDDSENQSNQAEEEVDFNVPGAQWRRVLEAVKNEDNDQLKICVQDVGQLIKQQRPSTNKAKLFVIKKIESEPEASSSGRERQPQKELYQHPNTGKSEPEVKDTDEFFKVTKSFKPCDRVKVQMCSKVSRGILTPSIQLFEITDEMHACVEHRSNPVSCFVKASSTYASQPKYLDIERYVNLWKPVLMMEIATSAVREDDVITLTNLCVTLSPNANAKLIMQFVLFKDYCKTHSLDVFELNLMCVRIRYPRSDGKRGFWVGHFQVDKASEKCDDKDKDESVFTVKARLTDSAIPVPESLVKKKVCFVTAELICLSTPDRRRLGALTCSPDSSELIQNVCTGHVSQENVEGDLIPRDDLSLASVHPTLRFSPLNGYQRGAVRKALTKPFTLIQGPPGTGKTVTGVHIAYWFAKANERRRQKKPDKRCMVFYCGPSNKSVDVVGRYLKRIPELKILRIYGQEIERKEFPVPDKMIAFRGKRVSSQLKADEELRDVSLHHLIRSKDCPFGDEVRKYDSAFEEFKTEQAPRKLIDDYNKVKMEAEQWAMTEAGVNVILCTCTSAYSPRIKLSCFAFCQCIVDECGMCIESETLCAMLGSNATQVVLIGDHKQLQPVIQNDAAKELGLGISMFERYSDWAQMLELQYRMHKEICEFPSCYFYDGKLKTAEVVRNRKPDDIDLWPRGADYPFVFYHIVGKEESLVVSTDQGNENSKRNVKEIKKVVFLARSLCNAGIAEDRIIVLSPYRAQCYGVGEKLKEHGLKKISVATVVASQGSEKDYVILSLVRSLRQREIERNPSRSWLSENLGFVTDEHQINVALTRSKRGLCIVGNANLVGVCSVWRDLLQHYEDKGCLVSDDPTLTPDIQRRR